VIFCLDTNTISYFLRGEGNIDNHFQNEIIDGGNMYVIPYIVLYEIRRWLLDKPSRPIQIFAKQFDLLFENIQEMAEMPSKVWDKAASIYVSLKQKGQLIGDVDILIAAYCLVSDYVLVTRNTSDFKRIDGLKMVNWYE
jgi:tRNA(fMet)-specific endonuclease VapC